MLKKVILGWIVLAGSLLFGMSLNELNSVSKAELMQVKGIGDAKATAIMKEREKGKFTSFEDFQRVKGIGKKNALNVKNHVISSSDMKKIDASKT